MTEELCKIIGIIIVIGFVIFLAVKSLKLQLSMIEGFVGESSAQPDASDSLNGVAGNVSQYANNIKMQVIKMQLLQAELLQMVECIFIVLQLLILVFKRVEVLGF